MPDGSKMLQRFKKVGSRWAFEMFTEVFYDKLIEGFREFLKPYTPEAFLEMVNNAEFPSIDPSLFAYVRGYEKYIEKVNDERIGVALARARPDLAEVLLSAGAAGDLYVPKLRAHFLELLMRPEKAYEQAAPLPVEQPRKMLTLTCENCHQSWPVPEDEVAKVTECPFCHVGRDEPAPPEKTA